MVSNNSPAEPPRRRHRRGSVARDARKKKLKKLEDVQAEKQILIERLLLIARRQSL
jgi:hypothetical protein